MDVGIRYSHHVNDSRSMYNNNIYSTMLKILSKKIRSPPFSTSAQTATVSYPYKFGGLPNIPTNYSNI